MSAPLTPLIKPDNGIRPIAVGTIWRRLVSKVAMKGVGKDMVKYLNDFQFGVGVSGGAEAVLHSANRVLCKNHDNGSLTLLAVVSRMLLTWWIDPSYSARLEGCALLFHCGSISYMEGHPDIT